MQDVLDYRRTIKGEGRHVQLFASTNPSILTIATLTDDGIAFRAQIDGHFGAELLVALASATTSANQGCQAAINVSHVAHVSCRKEMDGWWIHFDTPASSVVIQAEMMQRVLVSLQELLNDITGEYRRKIGELERAFGN